MTGREAEKGVIYRITLMHGPKRGHTEWFVGDKTPAYAEVVGVCFASEYQEASGYQRIGKGFSMGNCMVVPDDEVPDEIWAALARFRLTQ